MYQSRNHINRSCVYLFKSFILFALLAVSVTGCRVKLAGDYDQVVDKTVTELQQSTSSFFSKIKSSTDSERAYANNKQFYADSKAVVSVLIQRSKIIEKEVEKKPLTKNFESLMELYNDLEMEHKNNPSKIYFVGVEGSSSEGAKGAFDQAFRAIVQHMVILKWK